MWLPSQAKEGLKQSRGRKYKNQGEIWFNFFIHVIYCALYLSSSPGMPNGFSKNTELAKALEPKSKRKC